MKNRFKILGILVVAALLALSFTACDNYDMVGALSEGGEGGGGTGGPSFILTINGLAQNFNNQIDFGTTMTDFVVTSRVVGSTGSVSFLVMFADAEAFIPKYVTFAITAAVRQSDETWGASAAVTPGANAQMGAIVTLGTTSITLNADRN